MLSFVDVSKEILESWNRSINNSLNPYIKYPQISLNSIELKEVLKNERSLITVFNACTNTLLEFADYEKYIFLLFNTDKILLSKFLTNNNKTNLEKKGIKCGVSYSEESIGVNSVSLSAQTGMPVYIDAQQHFCVFMRDIYSYTVPLKLSGSIIGYINLATLDENKKDKLKSLAFILPDSIVNKIHIIQCRAQKQKLTNQQLKILTLLANGKKESQIAKELNYSIQTIKYHKQEIFKKLNVKNTPDAISKLYRYNESPCFYK